MAQYAFYYIEADLVCFLFMTIILHKIATGTDRSIKARGHLWSIASMMIFLLSDILWVLADAGVFSDYPFLFVGAIIFNSLSMAVCGYIFFIFTEIYLDSEWVKRRRNRVLCFIPAAFNAFMILLSAKYDLYFYIDGGKSKPGPVFSMMVLLIFIYLIIPFFVAALKDGKDKSGYHHAEYRAIMIFPMILAITGVLQVIWWKMPILCYGVVAANFYMYINFTNQLVSKDALTDTNNRRELKRYLDKAISNYTPGQNLNLIMIDIDHFKSINDRFGHAEGDRALRLVADVLKEMCYKAGNHYFIGRYGGDEFVIVARPDIEEELKSFISTLQKELETTNKANNLPYKLAISIGNAEYNSTSCTAEDLLNRADEDMYRHKRGKNR
ncbi:MAG: GGDEF domain-containing protein [Bilifractor sp.]